MYQRDEKLNDDAIKGIQTNLDMEDERDENVKLTIDRQLSKDARTMLIPTLTLHMRRCKERYEHHRAKAIKEKADLLKKTYSHKSKGAWSMGKKLNAGGAPPLIAVARLEKGPQGRAIGTIATAPQEVDAIIRKAYGKIYKGNCSDQQELLDKHLKDYDKFIFKMLEAEVDDITGEDVKAICNDAKHTAAGMDQWAPGTV